MTTNATIICSYDAAASHYGRVKIEALYREDGRGIVIGFATPLWSGLVLIDNAANWLVAARRNRKRCKLRIANRMLFNHVIDEPRRIYDLPCNTTAYFYFNDHVVKNNVDSRRRNAAMLIVLAPHEGRWQSRDLAESDHTKAELTAGLIK